MQFENSLFSVFENKFGCDFGIIEVGRGDRMKKLLTIILLFLLVGCNKPIEEEIDMTECSVNDLVQVNPTVTLDAKDLWTNALVCENLKYEDGSIMHDETSIDGVIETDVFHIDNFVEIVPSWNILIDKESLVSIYLSIGNEEGMSHYYQMALWREKYMVSFGRQEDDYGKVYIDTIVPNIDNANRFKIKIIISDSETSATAIRNFSVTTKLNEDVNYDQSVLSEKIIDVSPRQQMSVPSIGSRICSPTSLSMILNYYGFDDTQDIVAANVLDKGADIYGNWSFNASYPGGFGLFSRVEYIDDLEVLWSYIENDIPVALSIKTTDQSDLIGSNMAYPSGHLIVLVGFRQIDGVWYGVVNDPAATTDEAVPREYRLDQLLTAWRGYTYIVSTEKIDN